MGTGIPDWDITPTNRGAGNRHAIRLQGRLHEATPDMARRRSFEANLRYGYPHGSRLVAHDPEHTVRLAAIVFSHCRARRDHCSTIRCE